MTRRTERVFDDIEAERGVQDARWGGVEHDDRHDVCEWATFIEDYLNKLLRTRYTKQRRHRFVQIAALAVAAIEAIDRKEARRVRP